MRKLPMIPGRTIVDRLLILSALVLAIGSAAEARAQSPERLMEDRALKYIEVFNSEDVEAYGRFRLEHRVGEDPADESWRESFIRLRERFGRLDVQTVDFLAPFKMEIGARPEKEDATLVLTFEFEQAGPHRIAAIRIAISKGGDDGGEANLPPLELAPDMTKHEIGSVLDPYLQDLADRDLYSGTVLIARGGETLYRGAFGLASRSFEVPNRTTTRFRVGSITKDFTDVAIARLVSEGKLKPGDTIADHLPGYPNPEVAKKVTIDHLVNHTSGLGGMNYREFLERSPRRFRGPSDYIELFGKDPLLFEPGSERRYSNAGYIVLGAIIEAVTGKSYFAYIDEAVFGPAGMSRSAFLPLDRPHDDIAVGYFKCETDGEVWCNNYYRLEIEGGPSGGSYSTAEDLLEFDRALRANRLLAPEYTRWFFTRGWPEPEERVEIPDDWPPYGTSGGAEGVSALLASDGDLVVVVFCNLDGPAGEEIGSRIFRALSKAKIKKDS